MARSTVSSRPCGSSLPGGTIPETRRGSITITTRRMGTARIPEAGITTTRRTITTAAGGTAAATTPRTTTGPTATARAGTSEAGTTTDRLDGPRMARRKASRRAIVVDTTACRHSPPPACTSVRSSPSFRAPFVSPGAPPLPALRSPVRLLSLLSPMQNSADSPSPSSSASYARPRRAFGRTGKLTLAAVVAAACTTRAFLQRGPDDPFRSPRGIERLFAPMQSNRFAGRAAIDGDLRAVFVRGSRAWAGGDGGLLLWSDDGGVTWTRATVTGPVGGSRLLAPDQQSAGTGTSGPAVQQQTAPQATAPDTSAAADTLTADTTKKAFRASAPNGLQRLLGFAGPAQLSAQSGAPAQQTQRGGKAADLPQAQSGAAGSLSDTTKAHPSVGGLGLAADSTSQATNRDNGNTSGSFAEYTGSVRGIAFADDTHGWAITESGDVLKTTDGGRNWGIALHGLEPLRHVWISATSIFIASDQTVIVSADGGRTLTRYLDYRGSGNRVLGFRWFDNNLLDLLEVIRNDGMAIHVIPLGVTSQSLVATPIPGVRWDEVSHITFSDPNVFWAAVNRPDGTGHLYAFTTDGRSWREVRGPFAGIVSLQGRAQGGVLVMEDGSAHAADSSGSVTHITVPGAGVLRAAALDDNGRGVAVGEQGTVLTTADDGNSWRLRAGGRHGLRAVDFADRKHGWAVGSAGTVLGTDNGGRTWYLQATGTSRGLRAVRALSPDAAVAVGDGGTIVRTTDGGATWTEVQRPSPAALSVADTAKPVRDTVPQVLRRFWAVDFTGNTGEAVGDFGLIQRTTDGGATWSLPVSLIEGGPLGIRMADNSHAWLVTRAGISLQFDSAGFSQWFTRYETRDLAAIDARGGRVWAVGRHGKLVTSTDTGRTWREGVIDRNVDLTAVRFVSADTGWVAGRDGQLFSTVNGGVRWRREATGTDMDLTALAAREGRVWAVGSGATILRGPGTWARVTQGARWPAPWYYLTWLVVAALVYWAFKHDPPPAEESVEEVLVSDRPLTPTDPDTLGLKPIALAVSRFLRNESTDPPLTLAVTGKWGSGKSSLMNLVRADLQANGFHPVWFNAWHHQTEESLLAALLENVRAQAIPPRMSWAGTTFRARLLWGRVKKFRPAAIAALAAFFLYAGYLAADPSRLPRLVHTLAAAGAEAAKPSNETNTWGERVEARVRKFFPDQDPEGDAPSILVALLGALTVAATLERSVRAFGVKPASLLAAVTGSPRIADLEAKAGFRYHFSREFEEVTEALKPRDLVIFVDDLDRCRPKQVLEVLESINFLYSSGRCVIVMGMDPVRVIRCVGLGFKGEAEDLVDEPAAPGADAEEENGRERREEFAVQYLEKLVNIEVPVPASKTGVVGILSTNGHLALPPRGPVRRAAGAAWAHRAPVQVGALAVLAFVAGVWIFPAAARRPGGRVDADAAGGVSTAFTSGSTPAPAASADTVQGAPTAAATAIVPAEAEAARPARIRGEEPPPRTAWSVVVLALAAVAGLAVWRLASRPDPVVRDSPRFKQALAAWGPWVAETRDTPRAMKKFLNRVRYYAMRQRPQHDTPTRWDRAMELLGRGRAAPPADPDVIPDHVLVALAALGERDAARLADPATYRDFGQVAAQCIGPDAVRVLGYPAAVDPEYKGRFRSMAADIRVS
ncbi:MAG TPA: YCF48-related protein [Longimicrobium sp.]|nr:YCF48-related protein [Longimicrobium sp.]